MRRPAVKLAGRILGKTSWMISVELAGPLYS